MEKKNINLPYLFSILKQWLYETWSIRRKIKCAPILYATSSYILSKKESHVKILTALQLLPCVTDIFLLKAKKKNWFVWTSLPHRFLTIMQKGNFFFCLSMSMLEINGKMVWKGAIYSWQSKSMKLIDFSLLSFQTLLWIHLL